MQGRKEEALRGEGPSSGRLEKKSLHTIILEYLEERGGWVNGGEIERLAMDHGYKASNASRRLREMYEDKLVEREERRAEKRAVKTVWYHLLPDVIMSI
jgi:DNA-binding MarR family transcriptional regulator